MGSLSAFAHWASQFIRQQSDSPGTDMVLITGWMLGIFCAAYVAAILVGDLLFGSVWREVAFLGRRVDVEHEELATVELSTRNRTLHFSMLVVAILSVFVVGSHQVTDGFLPWYARYGYASSTLRGQDTGAKMTILREMTQAQDDRLIGNAKLMVEQLSSTDPEVAIQALWSIGEVGRRTVRSIELMETGVEGGDWIYGLKRYLEDTVLPRLESEIEAIGTDAKRGPALVYALIAMQSEKGRSKVRAYLKGSGTDRDLTLQVIHSVAEQRDIHLVGMLVNVLYDADPALVGAAAWAIGEVFGLDTTDYSMLCSRSSGALRIRCALMEDAFEQSTVAFKKALARFDASTDSGLTVHCSILEALQRTRPEDISTQLMGLFDAIEPANRRCPRSETTLPFQGAVLQCSSEEYREKVVKTLATVAQGNPAVVDWLRSRSDDASVASGLRADMRHILDVISERLNP
jgi:hypothetical protein